MLQKSRIVYYHHTELVLTHKYKRFGKDDFF